MEEGILDINGDAAVCRCGGRAERTVDDVPVRELGRDRILVYAFRCVGCGALGYQGLFSFMKNDLVEDLSG